jgi:hypothetical protein
MLSPVLREYGAVGSGSSAFRLSKPAIDRMSSTSTPPASMTSARPPRIASAAQPIEFAPAAQALETTTFGPLNPNAMLSASAAV